jgi:hypothetical protein
MLGGAEAWGQCEPHWLEGEAAMLPTGNYWDATLFDPDGPGPAREDLVVAGQFSNLGGFNTQIINLGRWDGARWRRLEHPTFTSSALYALGVLDFDGGGPDPARLVVGGQCSFPTFHDGPVLNIFATDGERVFPLGAGLPYSVRAIHVFAPAAADRGWRLHDQWGERGCRDAGGWRLGARRRIAWRERDVDDEL